MASDEGFRLLGEDLVRLCLDDPRTIFDSVCARYERKKRLYTRIGASDLLALNPHEHLSIFEPSVFAQFLPPHAPSDHSGAHIYATASQILKDISGDGKEAAIVFCGEAGAGKTTNFFNTLRFLAFIEERRRTREEEGNNSSNPKVYRVNLLSVKVINALELILAAFGAAKTIKNDRSTLHAYAVELHYRGSALEGLSFLDPSVPVELSRIIGQRKGEGNFCVFYQLCGGIDATQRETLGLAGADKYFYLNQGGCCQGGVKTSDFAELVDALSHVGFSDHQKELIWRLLAAILHIGNLFFKPQRDGNEEDKVAEIVNETELRWVSVLLQTDFEQLKRAFTHSEKDQRLNVESALDVRDAFAIILYGGLFRWILSRISMFFCPSSSREATTKYDGAALGKIILLDVPGSRRYSNNGYEEFCINLLNERLEHFFQQQRFGQFSDDQLQNVFASRGALSQYNWPCNERTMELLVKRPMGILPLLDDECKFPRGTEETFLQHCNINHLDNAIYAKARVKGRLEFGIRHHFGLSFYSIDGFLAKNRFQQPAFIFTILSRSKDTSMASVFGEMLSSKVEDRSVYVANEWHRGIVKLCEQLKSSRLHFVRCIRANIETPGGKMDQQHIQRQLRILTVSDHCIAVRDGFQHKIPIKKFANSFRALLPEEVVSGQNVHQIAKDVLDAQGIRYAGNFEFVSGYVFLMEPLFERLCELKQATLNLAALIIQRNFRKFLARRYFLRKRAAATQIQAAFRGWKCRKRWKNVALLRERTMNTLTESVREKAGEGQEQLLNMLINSGEQLQGELGALLKGMHSLCKQKDEQGKWTQFRDCSNYVPSTLAVKWKSLNAPTVPLEQFAIDQIKAIPVGARREPIVAPFLAKETEEEFLQSLALFRLVLIYQFQPESSSCTDPCRLAVLAKAIVRHGILFPSLRDELFLQLVNQTHKRSFPYCTVQPPPLSKMLFAGCLKMRSRQIEAVVPYGSRHFGPSLLEYNAFVQRRPFTLLAHFVTGESLLIETDAWKTAEEVVQTMLRQRGIGDSFGWCLELDDGLRCTCIHSSLFLFDAITQIEENRQLTEQFGTESPLFAFFDSPKSIGEEKLEKINNENKFGQSRETVDKNANSLIGRKHLLRNDFYRPKFAQSSSMERPLHQQPSAVRTRLDEGVQLRRSSNTNCMSRITEREEDGTSTNGEGTLGLIRDVPVPTSDGAVERFLDDVFEKALPPVDYDLLEDKDEAENEIPSKASTPWESVRRKLNGQCPTTQNANFIWPKRFVYKTGGGIFVERNEQEAKDVPEAYGKQQQFKTYQPNGEFTSTEQQMENGGENLLGQPTATMLRGMADVAFGVKAPLRHLPVSHRPAEEGRYEEVFNRKWGQYVPMKQYFENEVKTEEEEEETTESDTDDGLISETPSEEEAEAVYPPGNEWVPESEFALDILLFNTRPQAQQPSGAFSVVGENQPIPREIVNINNENSPKKAAKSVTALTYSQQPFRLILCRDLFVPGEVLDDALEIDLTFAQIIRDCRRQLCQPRIRRYEREAVQQLLRSFNVPPNALNKPSTIPTNVKLELIGIVRKWPLYFCRLFPVVEERPSGRFPQLLGISETGIRLVSVLSSQNGNGKEVNMAIQDHFDWCDIAELVLENDACALRIVTRQNIAILISGQQMARVKQLIESLVVDGTKRRHFVVAMSAYSTRESNVLSFESGDCIQLIDRPDSEKPSTSGQWLFGRMARASRGTKLDGRFGWFPAEYVLSDAEVGEQQREHSSNGGGDGPTTSNPFTTFENSFRECVGSEDPFSMAIPQSLEPVSWLY
uniref:Uncharacterized protein n=1 Tax=Globodera rostochiensis TaxID=31243 RepID=A0A914HC29_GLORO